MKQPPFLQLKSIFFCALVFIFSSNNLFAQTYIGAASNPADGGALPGPTVAVNPASVGTMQAGDLVIIYAHYFGTGVTLSMSETSNQTWAIATTSGSGNQVYAIFWCRFNGTWGANPSVTIGTGTNGMSASMHVFRPSNSSKGWAINAGPTNTPTGNNATAAVTVAQVTTTVTNTVTMAFWGSPASNTWGTFTGTGWNKPGTPAPAQYRNTQASSNQSHSAAYKIMAAAGATNSVTQTRSAGTMITQRSIISWAEADPPSNDLCTNAITLTSGATCTTTSGSLNYSTYTAGSGVPGCGVASPDVWYKFVAQRSNPTITTTFTSGTGQRRAELYGGTCGSLNSITCSGDNNNLNATGLTVGQTYYVRIYSDNISSYAFTICVVDPPTNDLCANAVLLTSAASCATTSGTLTNATYTSDASCGAANLDVWYKFVAQTNNPIITTTLTSGAGQRRTELYEGTCGSLNSLGCSGNNNTLNATSLTIGQTYYIRVYSNNTSPYNFTICVQDQGTANGTCGTATTLTPATSCTPVLGNLFLANQTNPTNGCGNYYDVWYQFTAPASYAFANITVTPTGSPSALTAANTFIEPFKTTCGSINNNSLSCSNIGMVRSMTISAGTTYFFRVYTTANPNVYGSSYEFNICITLSNEVTGEGGRMNEVFKQTILSPPNVLADPWEVTYGPDDSLWITESKGYKVYRMDPVTGGKETVLDISQNSLFLPVADQVFNCQFNNGNGAQGGLAGLALHPKFLDPVSPVNYVYVSYVYRYDSASVFNGGCTFFTNRLVRFTYDPATRKLGSPVSLCDTLPGGNDHNSQRIIIAPVTPGGPDYLFYAQGDLGAGQLSCRLRVQKAQMINSYEGKILRFNLETDNDFADTTELNNWIPNDNPYNTMLSKQSAVWAIGIRNNQGFAYDTALNILYGSSHGAYSDDEINVIEPFRNYGHPLIIGYADGNYNGTTTPGLNTSISAGVPFTDNNGVSTDPPIGDEVANKATIDAAGHGLYKDPLFSAYAAPNGDINTAGTIKYIWKNNPGNANPAPGWPSEAWSGLDIYTNSKIPGWKKSLVAASLKWGRLVRIKLGSSGNITVPSNDPINNAGDTISYFGSINRFRDLTFAPNGKDIYVIMDRSTTTSGPSAQWPVVPACQGCLQKYTFLGYNVNSGNLNKSYIPATIDIAAGLNNNCDTGNTVTINAANSNNNLWVPITDNNSNIIAEIYAQGQDLGNVTTRFYHNTNAVRVKSGKKYLDRNITITPQTQPGGNVKIRLYITEAEFQALKNAGSSGISTFDDIKVFKNNDACGAAMSASPTAVLMDFNTEAFGSNGYVLQGTISSFSTFYFGSGSMSTLPLDLITFTGSLQRDNTVLLKWKTENEKNTSYFIVERSIDGNQFSAIGNVTAKSLNSSNTGFDYSHPDIDAANQQSLVLYYRLKMVDIDGSYKYSNTVAITLNSITGKINVSPNPAKGIINVSLPSSANEKARWKLMDNNGRVLLQNTVQLRTGNNSWTIDISRFTAGTYYLIVSGTSVDQKIKLQKL